MSYKPRGKLARAIYERFHNDRFLNDFDAKMWYCLTHNLQSKYQSKFLAFNNPDEVTLGWLESTKLLSSNIWLQLWHAFAKSILQFFMTQTDINGFLRRGSMFILSEIQFAKLLKAGGFNIEYGSTINMLDIGAGDGEVSLRLLKSLQILYNNSDIRAYATETSRTMRDLLKKRNFTVLNSINDIDSPQIISCLNVLDRCLDPIQLLIDMHKLLAPNGRLILALVLPYAHYVECNSSHMPDRALLNHWPKSAKQYSFEKEAALFFELLEELNFCIEAWTKAPYFCEGDLRQSFYWLTDIVVVLSKKS